jgi:hypothetical protein
MGKQIKVWFEDFWGHGWDNNFNFFTQEVLHGVDFIVTPDNPDLLVYTVFGQRHKNYNCKKIFWTGENKRPNFNECDLAFSFDFDDNLKNVRVPLYSIHVWESLYDRKVIPFREPADILLSPKREEDRKRKFCTFIYGNGSESVNGWGNKQDGVILRNRLFDELNKYRKVDAAGSWKNNTGVTVDYWSKHKYIKDYKFVFSIENSSFNGYVTEKIMDPMLVGSVPIYWGSETIETEFNPRSFVNLHSMDINNVKQIAEYLIHLDNNQDEYDAIYTQPYINSTVLPDVFDLRKLTPKVLSLL